MIDQISSSFLVLSFSALAIFQFAIVLGAPLGEYAYGGQHPGVLPKTFRVSSIASMIFALAAAGHYLAQLGVFTPLLPENLNQIINWVFVGLAFLSAIMNNISRSKKERLVWGPTTILMLIAAVVVAL